MVKGYQSFWPGIIASSAEIISNSAGWPSLNDDQFSTGAPADFALLEWWPTTLFSYHGDWNLYRVDVLGR